MSTKPLVLVIGGAGVTGTSILKGLAKTGTWRLAASVRPSSISKPSTDVLRELGVEIRSCDWLVATDRELDRLFSGAAVVISAVNFQVIPQQTMLVEAAKRAGVQRFIPCDFGTACAPGIRDLHDKKLAIRNYVKESGIAYTFIDVGFWMQITFPRSPKFIVNDLFMDLLWEFHGDGDKKSAVVNKDHIGDLVAQIIVDPRTLNQYVFAVEDEVTLNEVWALAQRFAGEDMNKVKKIISAEELEKRKTTDELSKVWYEYMHSLYIRGDNTVEAAKLQGALHVKELYPELRSQSATEFAEQYYSSAPETLHE